MVRFDTYIYSKEVTVQSDHRPLMAIVKKSLTSASRRLQRMLLRLQRYNYTIVYVPGSQMVIADSCPEHICRTLRRQSSRGGDRYVGGHGAAEGTTNRSVSSHD